MKNGEGTGERLSPEVTPPPSAYDPLEDELLPWEDQKSDDEDDDDVSRYSSCGDSEFDRYCSANSAMGTPSVCGSVYEFADSEFGSLKSFKLGGDNRNLKNFGVDKRLSGFNDRDSCYCLGTEFADGSMRDDKLGEISVGTSREFDLYGNSDLNKSEDGLVEYDDIDGGLREDRDVERTTDHSSRGRDGVEGNVDIGDGEGHTVGLLGGCISSEPRKDSKLVEKKREQDSVSPGGTELVDGCLEGLHLPSGLDHHGEDIGSCLDEDEASLGHDHSEGEDSMFEYGSDAEKKPDSYVLSKVGYSREEGHRNASNELLMTSAIAFGSDDWDDFMQETRENALSKPFQDEFHAGNENAAKNGIQCLDSTSAVTVEHPYIGSREQHVEVVDLPRTNVPEKHSIGPVQFMDSSFSEPLNLPKSREVEQGGCDKGLLAKDNQVKCTSVISNYPQTSIKYEGDQEPLVDETPSCNGLNMGKPKDGKVHQYTSVNEITSVLGNLDHQNLELEKMSLPFTNFPNSDTEVSKSYPAAEEGTGDSVAELVKENESVLTSLLACNSTEGIMQNSPIIFDRFEDHFSSSKKENLETNGLCDEMVHEMEEILLDTEKSPLSRSIQSNRTYQSQIPLPSRDGGSTASTSGTDDAYYPQIQLPVRIDGVEVIGARQEKGGISLSERLVGVKEYTIYKIRVWSGDDKWEVERRYRDFFTLYHQLKKLFSEKGWVLPPPWHSVERESRKIFGNVSPVVISERSVLIQDCLQSIIQSQFPSVFFNALVYFLSPTKGFPNSSSSTMPIKRPPFSTKGSDTDHVSSLGMTVSLVVQIRSTKPIKQMLDAQNNSCAGCHKDFDDGITRMKELAMTLGWGKPRVCAYGGQLFCSTCHTNDTAVLPARVLHLWDFMQYPVSQIAKSYLDSIYDKPMLCVSAVNPFLFSKVPALQHVTNVRKRIVEMIPYVRCPFRRSIYKALGTRKYLLESVDFFALRDLIDLSKGMFAVLPVMVETVSNKILEHITEQCLVCCDAGIPCNARQACNDPSSLIFPFQEGETEKCGSCKSSFHRTCFGKVVTCSCGARLHQDISKGGTSQLGHNIGSGVGVRSAGKDTDTASGGFLSGLFSKVMPQRYKEHGGPKGGDTVILMGSFPNPSETL